MATMNIAERSRGDVSGNGKRLWAPRASNAGSGSAVDPQVEISFLAGLNKESAIKSRNAGWENNPLVPDWVNPQSVGLDAFFTRREIAKSCYASLLAWMQDDGADPGTYRFVEPSAGTGAFFDVLPPSRRVGIDLIPYRAAYLVSDFLSWQSSQDALDSAVIGNPPFGHRSWLALAFMNHAATFANYIGMILPMSFQSDGKGSPKHRVKGMRLLHSDSLPADAFTSFDGRSVKVNALWQVWHRGVNNSRHATGNSKWVDVFTVDARSNRLCGHKRLKEADWFLERSFYGSSPPSLTSDFSDVKHCGYGVVAKRDRERVAAALRQADWKKHSNLAAHNCRHISISHINAALAEAGLTG